MLPVKRRNYDFLDNFFDNFWVTSDDVNAYYPKVDINEDENNIYVDADLPGMEKKDVKLTIENNALSLSGAREQKREENRKGYYRIERHSGRFERKFYLGENVDSTKAKAEFDKGVLKIVIPKKEDSKPKAIDIEVK